MRPDNLEQRFRYVNSEELETRFTPEEWKRHQAHISPRNQRAIERNREYFERHEKEFAAEHPGWFYLISRRRVLLCTATVDSINQMRIQSNTFPLDAFMGKALPAEEREKEDRF